MVALKGMRKMQNVDAYGLVTYLAPEDDEIVIVSAVTTQDSPERLLRASLIIGPPELADSNWQGWQALHDIQAIGAPEPPKPTYLTSASQFRTYRVVTDISAVTRWLVGILSSGVGERLGILPVVQSTIEAPFAPLRISPRLGSPASTFVEASVRSSTGYLFRGPDITFDVPMMWESEEGDFVNSPLSAGLMCAPGLPGGIVLARLERRAWISSLRGGEELGTFDCYIGIESDRIDIQDLSVSLDEWINGELVHSQQVKLEDLDVDHVRGEPNIVIRLPTLGSGVERSVRLHDRHGTLLDASQDQFRIVESVGLTVKAIDFGEEHAFTTVIGNREPTPLFLDRSSAIDRVRQQYELLFDHGAKSTLLLPGGNVRNIMGDRLAQARGVLRIVDRYFGKSPLDWKMLDKVTVPIEVLTSKGIPPPPTATSGIAVRWITSKPPFHGRAYLWQDGGFSVDASPDGFGRDPVYITPLQPAVSVSWQALFAAWWNAGKTSP
jgi:hypothetical protein